MNFIKCNSKGKERVVTVGEVVVVYEDDKKRGEWKISVVCYPSFPYRAALYPGVVNKCVLMKLNWRLL